MTLKDLLEEARAEGREEGLLEEKRLMARAMLQGGKLLIADVAAYTGLFEAEIVALKV